MATRCCRCVGSGSCLRCSCVMRGTVCGDCYPSKKGRCLNQSHLICMSQSEHNNPTDDPSRVRDHVVGHNSDIDVPVSSLNNCPQNTSINNSFSSHILPGYKGSALPNFHWGQHDATTTINWLDKIYTEVVHWRYSLFSVRSLWEI